MSTNHPASPAAINAACARHLQHGEDREAFPPMVAALAGYGPGELARHWPVNGMACIAHVDAAPAKLRARLSNLMAAANEIERGRKPPSPKAPPPDPRWKEEPAGTWTRDYPHGVGVVVQTAKSRFRWTVEMQDGRRDGGAAYSLSGGKSATTAAHVRMQRAATSTNPNKEQST